MQLALAARTSPGSLRQYAEGRRKISSALAIQIENLSQAKSRIKDVDFATETAEYTQNNILQQASASVLANANQLPQIALKLLQQKGHEMHIGGPFGPHVIVGPLSMRD